MRPNDWPGFSAAFFLWALSHWPCKPQRLIHREKFLQLSKRHGDVFTLDMGMTRMVILASYDVIKEALVKNADVTAGRPMDMFLFSEVAEGKGMFADCFCYFHILFVNNE